ncbi:MAG: hypothetical protein ACP5T2_04465 [Thermoprotei archaeon]
MSFRKKPLVVFVILLFISSFSNIITTLIPKTVGQIDNNVNPAIDSIYWLKLGKIGPTSSTKIYMGFASPSKNLFNKVDVGEAPTLSGKYGEYDDAQNVFTYYTNFSSLGGWQYNLSKGSLAANNGLVIDFNGPGYMVTKATYGPGTAFVAYVNSIGDLDNVGYFDLDEPVNGHTGWAGSFIRLACGNTYPDQWNSSAEANGCGSPFGYFVNAEGIGGTYEVQILNSTSSVDDLNFKQSAIINRDYPIYPANVGFDGQFNPISIQWAFVMRLPPQGIMPSVSISPYASSISSLGIVAPTGISYAVPVTITNSQGVSTSSVYQQLLAVNSSLYSSYEASNLQNVEFFYSNGTVIPSWLQTGNSNHAGIIDSLTVRVYPTENSYLYINGTYEALSNGNYTISDIPYATHYNVFVENPNYE